MAGSVVFLCGSGRFGQENSGRFEADSVGIHRKGTEPLWNGSGCLPFSWNSLEVKGTVRIMGRKIEDFTGTFRWSTGWIPTKESGRRQAGSSARESSGVTGKLWIWSDRNPRAGNRENHSGSSWSRLLEGKGKFHVLPGRNPGARNLQVFVDFHRYSVTEPAGLSNVPVFSVSVPFRFQRLERSTWDVTWVNIE